MRIKDMLFGTAITSSPAGDLGLLLLRVFTAVALAVNHGFMKMPPSDGFIERVGEMGFPAPVFFAWMSGIAEVVGSLLLALGLMTRPVALLILINMAVVSFLASAGDDFGQREKPLLFLSVALLYTLLGAGRYSLDAMIRKTPPRGL